MAAYIKNFECQKFKKRKRNCLRGLSMVRERYFASRDTMRSLKLREETWQHKSLLPAAKLIRMTTLRRPLVSLLLSSFLILVFHSGSSVAEKCPQETLRAKSEAEKLPQKKKSLVIENQSPLPLLIHWVNDNDDGKNSDAVWGPVQMDQSEPINTFSNHRFRIYGLGRTTTKKLLLLEHTANEESYETLTVWGDCDEVHEMIRPQQETSDVEMRSLVHDQDAPCVGENSSEWSCIRYLSKEDYDKRLEQYAGTIYGFNSTEEAETRNIGDTVDTVHVNDIPHIPRVNAGKGFLKMSFTDKMKEVLLPFFETHKRGGPNDSEDMHQTIPGGFTNSHTIPMSIIVLDRFPEVHMAVTSEIHRILEWWTNQTLVPTATFGIRNYHRGSMLINHADRADTHVASAVIQVAQEGVDEGWPLEVLHPDGGCSEVYLQPGELVLYEGARFLHGRPMRFNGTSFANIFSHFRPVDWHGPGKSPKYDGKLDQDGFLIGSKEQELHSQGSKSDEL